MRILITGGNGFLGSNLIEHLLNCGHKIFAISRNSNNISQHVNLIKFEKYQTEDYFIHQSSILDFNAEVVIHLAWEGGNSYNDINDPNQIHKNISAGFSLLEIVAMQSNKPKFIGCGSFLEYGSIKTKAVEDMIENPSNLYGLSKFFFKSASKMYCEQRDILWTWIRPCYIYGRKDVKTRLIPSVISRLLRGEDLILDDCNTVIDYLHVEDFCFAISNIIQSNSSGVFNICSGEEYVLKDIVSLIRSKIDPKKSITFDSTLNRSLKPGYICGCNNRLKTETNWFPKISLEEGILKTIDSHKLQ